MSLSRSHQAHDDDAAFDCPRRRTPKGHKAALDSKVKVNRDQREVKSYTSVKLLYHFSKNDQFLTTIFRVGGQKIKEQKTKDS